MGHAPKAEPRHTAVQPHAVLFDFNGTLSDDEPILPLRDDSKLDDDDPMKGKENV